MSDLPVVAISVGDTNGIGTEIILKSFESKELFKICTPVLYCDYDFVEKLQKIYKTKVNLFKVKNDEFFFQTKDSDQTEGIVKNLAI